MAVGEREKVHDKFHFPFELNLAPITENLEIEQFYDLVGIIVHSTVAAGGHHFNYIRVNEKWMTFSDCVVSSANNDTLMENCVGGNISTDVGNVYVVAEPDNNICLRFVLSQTAVAKCGWRL
jgi:hypothetical protein